MSEFEPVPIPEPTQRLDRRVLVAWRVRAAVTIATTVAIVIAAELAAERGVLGLTGLPGWVWGAAAAALVAEVVLGLVVIPQVRFATWRYGISEECVALRRGTWTTRLTLVPLVRVQYVETKEGPVLRALGLATVSISTANDSFDVPGLPVEEAAAFRDLVSDLAARAREEA